MPRLLDSVQRQTPAAWVHIASDLNTCRCRLTWLNKPLLLTAVDHLKFAVLRGSHL